MGKLKSVLRELTDSIGLTFDHNEDEHEFEDEGFDEIAPSLEKESTSNNNSQQSQRDEQLYNSQATNNIDKSKNEDDYIDHSPIFVNPKSFAECRRIADFIKRDKVVTLNLENVNPKDAQRILDFLSGAIKIKEAKWIPISKCVFTSVPKGLGYLYDGKKDIKQNTFLDVDNE